jgi:hypothetical protein
MPLVQANGKLIIFLFVLLPTINFPKKNNCYLKYEKYKKHIHGA